MVGLYSVQLISANFMSEETAEKETQLSIKRLENGSGELQVGRPRWESNTVRELKKGQFNGKGRKKEIMKDRTKERKKKTKRDVHWDCSGFSGDSAGFWWVIFLHIIQSEVFSACLRALPPFATFLLSQSCWC